MIEKPERASTDDDLFGGDKPPRPAAEAPEAAPEEPVKPQQKQPEEAPEPVPAQKTPEQGDEDLFDDPGAPAAVKPAPAKPAAAEPEEDLFDPEVEPKAENQQPAEEPTSPKPADGKPAGEKNEGKADEAEEDPFAGILQTPDEPMRIWIDDTGRHRTVARLVEVRPEGVRLLKANGRFSNVPFSRLSDHDRFYATATASRVETQFVQQPKPNDTAGL